MTTNHMVKTSNQPGTGIAAIGNGNSVLGQLQPRIPTGGRIRAGIMVLTKAASSNKKAVDMYAEGVANNVPFMKLAREIQAACGLQRSPLTPRNVPYFTVRASDFKTPGLASSIIEKYGEDRGDGSGRQLYRFPVIFALDNWQGNMPHEFACYTASERLYWSEYDQDGNRYCLTHGDADFIQVGNQRQARRTAGGRPVVARASNGGICNPEECPEYQSRACTITGRFLFYIPGMPGSSAIELPTRSFYALQNARQQMEMMAYITGGRISGTHNGKALFWISKKNEVVSMIDPATGKAKRVNQWIISLEADVDMTRIFEHQEAAQALADGNQAAAALGYTRDDDYFESEFDVLEHQEIPADVRPAASKPVASRHAATQDPPKDPPKVTKQADATQAPAATAKAQAESATTKSAPASDEAASIEAAIKAADDIDGINVALDRVNGNEQINSDDAKRLRKLAGERVKAVRA